MARSVFLLNSERKNVIKAQFRKLSDDFRQGGLCLEGPFKDKSDSVASLSSDVKARMRDGGYCSPIGAAIATLAPHNMPYGERTWLDVPFVLRSSKEINCDCAGEIASAEPFEHESRKYRPVDNEGLHMLAVALMRRLGVPSYFAYQHFNTNNPGVRLVNSLSRMLGGAEFTEPLPCILTLDGEPGLVSIMPPYLLSFPAHRAVAAIEVLDDDALLSLVKIKTAHLSTLQLMRDSASVAFDSPQEAGIRAMSVGHLLHGGVSLWPLENAEKAADDALALVNPGNLAAPLRSIRVLAERSAVHNIICPVHHQVLASKEILCEEAREILDEMGSAMFNDGGLGAAQKMAELSNHGCLEALHDYMKLARDINVHVHPPVECPDRIRMN